MMEAHDTWDVNFMRWADFKKLMLEREKNSSWAVLWKHTDLILGGLNWSSDFLYVLQNNLPAPSNLPLLLG